MLPHESRGLKVYNYLWSLVKQVGEPVLLSLHELGQGTELPAIQAYRTLQWLSEEGLTKHTIDTGTKHTVNIKSVYIRVYVNAC